MNFLTSSQYRALARKKIHGHEKTLALITLAYLVVTGLSGGILSLLITGPLALSWTVITYKIYSGRSAKVEDLLEGFKNFSTSFCLSLVNSVIIALWSLLLIVPGVIKSLAYSMSFYILRDNPNTSANDARLASERLMDGHKWRLFKLELSFIGWFFLSALTLGILLVWVMPYYNTAVEAFYFDLAYQPAPPADGAPPPPDPFEDMPEEKEEYTKTK